ncbi:MAG: hypothetical protein JST00_34000 [Deltaproteobacteria bacterium]|nr:hypothetical protein [Deltaproteobacteria bacterium]
MSITVLAALYPLLAACGDSGTRTTPDVLPAPPPEGRPDEPMIDVPPPPFGEAIVERRKELLVVDEALLAARSDGARADAPWSFRHLVEELAAPGDPQAFVRSWLATWSSTSTESAEGSLPLDVRSAVESELVCPWLRATPTNECDATCGKCSARVLDLSKAPFRLLAIVNRLDLAEMRGHCDDDAAEGRFVFAMVREGGAKPFEAIFEYGVKRTKAGDARAWHALGGLDGRAYAEALEAITRSFSDRAPGEPTRLKQLRTSENLGGSKGTSFELRQFAARDGRLVPTALTNTARDSLNGTSGLDEHVSTHFSEIMDGDNAITLSQRTAVSTMPRANFRWSGAGGSDNLPLDMFGFSTCNGCHAGHRGDTETSPFAHVSLDESGHTILSRFLDDPLNPLSDELGFRSRSLRRRLEGRCGSEEAGYSARRGLGGLPRRESPVRTH